MLLVSSFLAPTGFERLPCEICFATEDRLPDVTVMPTGAGTSRGGGGDHI
jgi:hypothetical protein